MMDIISIRVNVKKSVLKVLLESIGVVLTVTTDVAPAMDHLITVIIVLVRMC